MIQYTADDSDWFPLEPGVEVFEGVDGSGNPILLAVPSGPRQDKTGTSTTVAVKSGNPFRDPGSGTFGNGPAGSKVTKGGDILTKLTRNAQLYVTQIRNKTNAKTIEVDVVRGRAKITMKSESGAVLATLDLPIPAAGQAPKPGDPSSTEIKNNGSQPASAPSSERDAVTDRARGKESIEKLDKAARAQRINDLVDYLFARYNASGAIFAKPGEVRIEAPAGWDKKNISGLSDQELQEVSRRMAARGWSKEAVQKLLLPNIKTERRDKIVTPKEKK